MSTRRFQEFAKRFPAYRDVPFQVRDQRVFTLTETSEIPVWGVSELWKLTEEYYRRLAVKLVAKFPKKEVPTILTLSGWVIPIPEAVMHIQRKDEIGKWLMENQHIFLQFIRQRMMETGYG